MVYKRKPIIPFEERLESVADLRYVDEVVRQDALDPTENLKKYKPDIVTHSHSENEKFPGKTEEFAAEVGIRLVRTRYYLGQSTAKIIEKIRSNEYEYSDS